ncbi:hypothetical protein J008_02792 [Cryptococcus neoformans]|nr:hypothetical protein J008_02792 [Cryptococcus neoformans var. grubii]
MATKAVCRWEFMTRVLYLLHGLRFQNMGPNRWQQVRVLPCAYKLEPSMRSER